MSARPVILLAFSYDAEENPLPEVYEELKTVVSVFENTDFVPEQKWKVRQKNIEDVFQKYKEELRIFHFSGHAGKSILQVNQDEYTAKIIFAEGLSGSVGLFCKNMKLVFLNGCSTRDQAEFFLKNGVSAVIATTKPVKDKIARAFAIRFYENFTSAQFDLSLQQAFAAALESIATAYGPLVDAAGIIQIGLLDDAVRGSFDFDEADDQALYELHIHPDAELAKIKHETFRSWGGRALPGVTVPVVDDLSKIKSAGVDEHIYLLCNRRTEDRFFTEKLQAKLAGTLPAPYFFIIHDDEEDCPDLLSERFQRFGIPSLYRLTQPVHDIELPMPEDLFAGSPDDPANPYRDKYKIYLSELYKSSFGGQESAGNQLCPLARRPADEPLLVVHHTFYPDYWQDTGDAARDAELRTQAGTFFRFYLDEFSTYLQQGFSERLLVVFSVKYYTPNPYFPALFLDLEQAFGHDRVKSLGNLSRIVKPDVDRWQRDFLKEQFFLINDIFKREEKAVGDLSFFETKEKLEAQIQRFNRKKASYADR